MQTKIFIKIKETPLKQNKTIGFSKNNRKKILSLRKAIINKKIKNKNKLNLRRRVINMTKVLVN
jgi:hypothetical protein